MAIAAERRHPPPREPPPGRRAVSRSGCSWRNRRLLRAARASLPRRCDDSSVSPKQVRREQPPAAPARVGELPEPSSCRRGVGLTAAERAARLSQSARVQDRRGRAPDSGSRPVLPKPTCALVLQPRPGSSRRVSARRVEPLASWHFHVKLPAGGCAYWGTFPCGHEPRAFACTHRFCRTWGGAPRGDCGRLLHPRSGPRRSAFWGEGDSRHMRGGRAPGDCIAPLYGLLTDSRLSAAREGTSSPGGARCGGVPWGRRPGTDGSPRRHHFIRDRSGRAQGATATSQDDRSTTSTGLGESRARAARSLGAPTVGFGMSAGRPAQGVAADVGVHPQRRRRRRSVPRERAREDCRPGPKRRYFYS